MQLINAANTVIDTDDPASAKVDRDIASGLDASASGSSLPSGLYYARVDGVGRGTAGTTYTDYGSVGEYTLDVTGCNGVVDPVADPPSAPLNLTGEYLGAGDVELSWSPPADDGGAPVTGYDVYMDDDFLGTVPTAGAIVDNVPTGEHDFGVAAVNSEGAGPQAHVIVDASDVPGGEAGEDPDRQGQARQARRQAHREGHLAAPGGSTNPAIDGYQVLAFRQKKKGKYVKVSLPGTRRGRRVESCSRRIDRYVQVRGEGAQRARLRRAQLEVERRPTAVGAPA